MSILKLGASLEGLLGLKGAMTWTVTQKLGAAQSMSLEKILKNLQVFPRELVTGFLLIAAAFYGHHVGASWVFTVYFFTQGIIFLIFALSLVEAFNLQPPSEATLLGLEPPKPDEAGEPLREMPPKPPKPLRKERAKAKRGAASNGLARAADDDDDDDDDDEEEDLMGNGHAGRRTGADAPRAPSLLRVLYANTVIFLYALPINAFSILLLYGVTTMLLSELINTQWDDVIALSLAIVIIPCHMFWCLGNPTANWKHRRLARARRLPLAVKLKQFVQLQLLCARAARPRRP